MLTDKEIKSAISGVSSGLKPRDELIDGGERKAGRLVLTIRQGKNTVTAEWYARYSRVGKRHQVKIGGYPALTLAEARKEFREKYVPAILKGETPNGPRGVLAAGGGTVLELFTVYVEHGLKGRACQRVVRDILLGENGAANGIGPNMRAADVRRQHILPLLSSIYERGAKSYATQYRNWISAAFSYGMKASGSYFNVAGARDWGIEVNPVASIRPDRNASQPRDRNLSELELARFWSWLRFNQGSNKKIEALMLLAATGQRPGEILKLHASQYDVKEGLLSWKKTKNGMPHCIPLSRQATEVLASLTPNANGFYFVDEEKPVEEQQETWKLARLIDRFVEETGAEPFETRDLRRTWKTLAGAAGISREIRDRMQNHALRDIASKHYDRWSYLPEKRAGMATWADYLEKIISGSDFSDDPTATWGPAFTLERVQNLQWAMGDKAWLAANISWREPDWIGNAVLKAFDIKRRGDWKMKVRRLTSGLEACGIIELSQRPATKYRMIGVLRFSEVAAAAVIDVSQKRAQAA